MRWFLALLCLAGCDRIFRLSEVPDFPDAAHNDAADAPSSTCLIEHFTGDFNHAEFAVDNPVSPIAVEVATDQLAIRPPPDQEGYNSLVTLARHDLTNGYAQVRVDQILNPGNGDSQFWITPDGVSDTTSVLMYATGGFLGWRRISQTGDIDDGGTDQYVPANERYWRIRFIDAGTAAFETSPSGLDDDWTLQRITTIDFAIDNLYVYLLAGTYLGGISNPGQTLYDDLTICPAP